MENTAPLYSLRYYGLGPSALVRMAIEHRRLIARLSARELIARYRGSLFGFLWLFFTPLCMLAIYTVIFSQVFKARWDVAFESQFDFALILFLGLILFNLFGEVFARSPTLMLENVSYIKKVVFPIEILSIVAVTVALVNAAISLGILVVFYVAVRGLPPVMTVSLPLYLVPCAFYGLGCAWLLSSLGVFLRDLKPLVALVSMVLLFLSPIFYPLSAVPQGLQALIVLNPLTQIIEDARAVAFKHQSPHLILLTFQIALSWLFAWGCYLWFMKTKKDLLMSSNTVIEVRDLAKAYRVFHRPQDRLKQMLFGRFGKTYYQEYWALSNVSATINRGETVGIIGRNGSGKSTFLQLLCGTLSPTAGALSVKGKVAALLELGAGFNPEFTGLENVRLSGALLGLTDEQVESRLDSILDFAGIGDFINQPVKVYSSGMYARLAFAVAAHADADILIVDEILAVGDVAFTQKCMRFIREFQSRGTLLFVSHSVESVLDLCKRAIWLDGGVVRAIGDSKDVVHQYTASLYEEKDSGERFKIGGGRKTAPTATSAAVQDHRRAFLAQSNVRNDVEVFSFEKDAAWFGHQGAVISDVHLYDHSGGELSLLLGGEMVTLKISAKAEKGITRPIVGFFIKDSRGQFLFGDNTYLTYQDQSVALRQGDAFTATFTFQMPYLPSGDYSVLASVAEGTQEQHIQHQWIDDALFFKVHSSHVAQGLIGVPMQQIQFSVQN